MPAPSIPRRESDEAQADVMRPITLRIDVPADYPDDLRDDLMRICRMAAPMLAEGTPAEVLLRKWMPREWVAPLATVPRGDWPPPEPQP